MKKSRLLTLLVLSLFFISCGTFNRRRELNYHSNRFECVSEPGWRYEKKKYEKYLIAWTGFKEIYNKQNQDIKKLDAVIVGDSLVHLFHDALLIKEFPGIAIYNRGIGGDMTDLLLSRIEENVLSLNPPLIIIEIGGNDLIQGRCLSNIEENVIKIVNLIHEKNKKTKILFLSIIKED